MSYETAAYRYLYGLDGRVPDAASKPCERQATPKRGRRPNDCCGYPDAQQPFGLGAAPTRSGAAGSEFRDLVLDDYYLHYGQRDAGAEPEAYLETDVGETRLNLPAQLANGGFLPRPRPGGEWMETVDAVDVQEIDGVFLPTAGRLTRKSKWASGEESEDGAAVRRREIVLHPDFQALGAFQIVLPEGTEVRLGGNSQRTFRWSQGKFSPDINKYLTKSLLGKPLPGLEAIRMDWDPLMSPGKYL